jgi:hypothetical protein
MPDIFEARLIEGQVFFLAAENARISIFFLLASRLLKRKRGEKNR